MLYFITHKPIQTASNTLCTPAFLLSFLNFIANYVQPVTNRYEVRTVWKETLQSKVATMKYADNFQYIRKPLDATAKFGTFYFQQRCIRHKGGLPLKSVLYVLWYAKSISQAGMILSSEEIKPVTLAVMEDIS